MNARLGVIKILSKVSWMDQHGPHVGRVQSMEYLGGIYWARVSYLPQSSQKEEAWIPLIH